MFRSDSVDNVHPPGPSLTLPSQLDGPSTARAYRSSVAKRAMDLSLGFVALVALAPLFILVALAVLVSSGGPVLFRQERVGLGKRRFTMLKFRTMRIGMDDAAHRAYVRAMLNGEHVEVAQTGLHKLDDDRVTAVGAVLRRLSLDELPQLLSVLSGSMSLVGPRPVLPWEVELLGEVNEVRFDVKPGMTGLWQVSGRSRLPMSKAFELDREYVARQSLLLDLKILLKTIPAVFAGDAA
jgi:lipopolysaccharide/colanic/teichoic acid biosynthesis glycosyltransferase